MIRRKLPNLPIPSPLRGVELNTWTNYSITVRLPEIGQRVLAENSFNSIVTTNLTHLFNEIPDSPIREIRDPGAPDIQAWNNYCSPYLGLNWLEVPWFFTENFFYRRILEATGYFQSGADQFIDPFIYQKQQGLAVSNAEIRALGSLLEKSLENTISGGCPNTNNTIKQLLYLCLWGNSLDLSLWPANSNQRGDKRNSNFSSNQRANILVEDSPNLFKYFGNRDQPIQRVDVVLDNAGYELVCDLTLIDFLLETGLVNKIYLHPKIHPTFVSDTIHRDIESTMTFLSQYAFKPVKSLGNRLQDHFQNQRLNIKENIFWNSPLYGWEMPDDLYQELGKSDLIVSKGDALYRRWHGDCHWPFTTSFPEIMAYVPAPILTLRTIKAQVVSGLQSSQIVDLDLADPDWMINGRWGVIQFYAPA